MLRGYPENGSAGRGRASAPRAARTLFAAVAAVTAVAAGVVLGLSGCQVDVGQTPIGVIDEPDPVPLPTVSAETSEPPQSEWGNTGTPPPRTDEAAP